MDGSFELTDCWEIASHTTSHFAKRARTIVLIHTRKTTLKYYQLLLINLFKLIRMDSIQSSSSKSASIENLNSNDTSGGKSVVSMIAKKRHRRIPQRFGDIGHLNLSDSYEDLLNLGDDSFDDKNFEPEENAPRVVATVTHVSARISKKRKTDSPKEDNGTASASSEPQGPIFDLNDEFDVLSNALPEKGDIIELSPGKNLKMTGKNAQTIEFPDTNIMMNYCKQILSTLQEQSARLSLIEGVVMNFGQKDRKTSLLKKGEQSRSFALANRLPINNADDLKMFGENLNKDEFQNMAVSLSLWLL